MLRFLKNARVRAWVFQALVLLIVVGVIVSFVTVARQNLLEQGIATGFDFLEHSTGWPINFALIEISARSPYWRMLLAGLLNTLLVGALGLALATVLGTLIGLFRISTNFVLNIVGVVYVEIFRNVPLILQVFFWYALLLHLPRPRQAMSLAGIGYLSNRGLMLPTLNMTSADVLMLLGGMIVMFFVARHVRMSSTLPAVYVRPFSIVVVGGLFLVLLHFGRDPGTAILNLPELQGLRFVGGFVLKPEFAALLISITVFGGAYIAEIVRGGILSIDKGKIEAAYALGLKSGQVNRLVRLPLAVRAILPALTNQYVWLMKATTLGIAIGFPDYFMVVSTSINQSGQAIELLSLLMGGFLLINYCVGFVMNRLNAHLAIKGHQV